MTATTCPVFISLDATMEPFADVLLSVGELMDSESSSRARVCRFFSVEDDEKEASVVLNKNN